MRCNKASFLGSTDPIRPEREREGQARGLLRLAVCGPSTDGGHTKSVAVSVDCEEPPSSFDICVHNVAAFELRMLVARCSTQHTSLFVRCTCPPARGPVSDAYTEQHRTVLFTLYILSLLSVSTPRSGRSSCKRSSCCATVACWTPRSCSASSSACSSARQETTKKVEKAVVCV